MKRYKVVITSGALNDANAIFDYITASNPRAAAKTVQAFRARIRSLATMPQRYSLAPENDSLDHGEIRHMHHGRYRIIYAIEKHNVLILEIRHGARLPRGH